MDAGMLALMIPIVAIVGGVTLAILNSHARAREAQAKHEERMAMIEQGMHPDQPEFEEDDDPERDPRLIER